MLYELRIHNLGVVADVTLVLRDGMTAVTGETGAGKTMLVQALRLLGGARTDPNVVRAGCAEAVVEGRFGVVTDDGEREMILTRVVPVDGRSRAYIDGRMASSTALEAAVEGVVELHAQHAQQSLLAPGAQRDALDRFGGVDSSSLQAARRESAAAVALLEQLGGDATSRAREIDLLSYQLAEIDAVGVEDPTEATLLAEREELLADVAAHREAAELIHANIAGDDAAGELVANALAAADARPPLQDLARRLAAVSSELNDLAIEVSTRASEFVDDPATLAEVQQRRHLLRGLERKYGPDLTAVIDFARTARTRLQQLQSHDESLAEARQRVEATRRVVSEEERRVHEARTRAAPKLSRAVEEHLRKLALASAELTVQVDPDEVTFMLSTNPGLPRQPLARAASGGELSRTMLALHLALLDGKPALRTSTTLVFDEVDAGVGGEAAVSIGLALSELAAAGHQVLVVTHLAQVAAFGANQLSVSKKSSKETTTTTVLDLADDEREVELARMLAGRPDSRSGREHARELMNRTR